MAGTKWVGLTRLMLYAPCSTSSRKISARRAGVMDFPNLSWLIGAFWQKTQDREQPEKKTVPEPPGPSGSPLIQGSSPLCRAARATTGPYGIRQYPLPSRADLAALHWRGQDVQMIFLITRRPFIVKNPLRSRTAGRFFMAFTGNVRAESPLFPIWAAGGAACPSSGRQAGTWKSSSSPFAIKEPRSSCRSA